MKNKYKKGFTLVELLVYMAIFSILLTITLQMYSSIFDSQLESQATSSVSSDARFIIGRFTYDLNRATSITTPSSLGTTSATLTFVANSQALTYSLNNGNFILQNGSTGTTDQLNSNDSVVSSVSFVRLDGTGKDIILMSFTLTSATNRRSGKEVKTFQTSAGLR